MDTAPDENLGASAAETPQTCPPEHGHDQGLGQEQGQSNHEGHARHPDEQRLHRVGRGRMLGGVAAGLADYFDVDPTIVRIGFVAMAFLGGLAVPIYLAGWLLIPDEDSDLSVAEELVARERAHSAS
jgi:phage shock protein PspC (stress-responsive transcriptional regulator)